jgi:hypothetical protein
LALLLEGFGGGCWGGGVHWPARALGWRRLEGLAQEERDALLAAEKANLERLLTAVSASINRDLPLKMEEVVRREVAGASAAFAAAVAPAITAALKEALPKVCLSGTPLVCYAV